MKQYLFSERVDQDVLCLALPTQAGGRDVRFAAYLGFDKNVLSSSEWDGHPPGTVQQCSGGAAQHLSR